MGYTGLAIVGLVIQLMVWRVGAIDCKSTSQFTIESAEDVSEINKCATFGGSILISTGAPPDLALDGIKSIAGNLTAANIQTLRSLSSTSLFSVPTISFESLPHLSTLAFPAITTFSSLRLIDLPQLQTCTFATGAISAEIESVTISHTSLQNLDWLKWPIGSVLNITSNANLTAFHIPYNAINSATTLAGNPSLQSIDVAAVSLIPGSFDVSTNDAVDTLAFTKLETIAGYVQLSGGYTNISMPALHSIDGYLKAESTHDIHDLCATLDAQKFTGHYDCASNAEVAEVANEADASQNSNAPGTSSSAAPSASATELPTYEKDDTMSLGAKLGIAVAVLALAIFGLAAFCFFFRVRSRAKVREISAAPSPFMTPTSPIQEPKPVFEPAGSSRAEELDAGFGRAELPGKEAQEMEAGVPVELDGGNGALGGAGGVGGRASLRSMSSVGSQVPLMRYELPG